MTDVLSGVMRRPRTVEWPTVALAFAVYGGWLAVTLFWDHLPVAVLVGLGGWFVAWQGSLQHEVIHGHPTGRRRVDDAVGWPPLSLWLPYPIYRETHLLHHRDAYLTDPIDDPESQYLARDRWHRLSGPVRAVLQFNATLFGRLTVGPVVMIGLFLAEESRLVVRGEPGRRRIWTAHLFGIAAVTTWTSVICDMPVWVYLAAFVYPGAALTRLRSYAEHRWAETCEGRTAVVERGGLLGLLFLNNNLHALHHRKPGIPWYRLPAVYRRSRQEFVGGKGPVYDSYGDVARRFLFHRHDHPLYPPHRTAATSAMTRPAIPKVDVGGEKQFAETI